MHERRRTVLLFQATLAVERQEPILLEYVREHRGYEITSLTASPSAAVALVRDHLADVVLVCFTTPGTDELADVVGDFGGVLEAVRQTRRPGAPTVDQRNAKLVRQAAERGATPEMTAAVLGMPLRQVLDALAARPVVADPPAREMYIQPVERRPLRPADQSGDERGVSPRERRPQPLRQTPGEDPRTRTSPVERPAQRRPRAVRSA